MASKIKVIFNNLANGVSIRTLLVDKFGLQNKDIETSDVNAIVEKNRDAIVSLYEASEQDKSPFDYVKLGTKLIIPIDVWNRLLTEFPKRVRYEPFSDIKAFWGDAVESIQNDEKFAPRFSRNFIDKTGYQKKEEFITVYAYSKVLEKYVNLTHFITNINTGNTNNGGQFSFELPPITGELVSKFVKDATGGRNNKIPKDEAGKVWSFIESNFNIFTKNSFINYVYKDSIVKEQKGGDGKSDFVFSKFIFNFILSQMDMVWIKYERLQIEGEIKEEPFIDVSSANLNKHYWDFIGFIDTNQIQKDPQTSRVSINVTGRGYNKLFLDDGVYYFPFTTGQNTKGTEDGERTIAGSANFMNDKEASKSTSFNRLVRLADFWVERRFLTGTSPATLIGIVINQASTIKVLPEGVFDRIDGAKPRGQRIIGAWRLFDLVVDEVATKRLLVNSSFATQKGNLWSFIDGLCIFPFLEIIQDTYKRNHYMIVREPPLLKNQYKKNYTVTIESTDLRSMDVQFEQSRVYSWYRLIPNAFFAGDDLMSSFYFPAVFLPEYAEVFGSRPLELTSNYIDYGWELKELDLGYRQVKQDLERLITVNAYMPFIRQGTIVINGNRTIKKGMNVYVRATDEIYHVVGVQNSYANSGGQVSRQTVLRVDRGMVSSHYDKYFDIIKFGKFEVDTKKSTTIETAKQAKGQFKWDVKVNKDVFDFFIKRKQFG